MVSAEEFQRLEERVRELEALEFTHLRLVKQHKEPARPRDGMVVFADGVDWNPGGCGSGIYYFDTGAWHLLATNCDSSND